MTLVKRNVEGQNFHTTGICTTVRWKARRNLNGLGFRAITQLIILDTIDDPHGT